MTSQSSHYSLQDIQRFKSTADVSSSATLQIPDTHSPRTKRSKSIIEPPRLHIAANKKSNSAPNFSSEQHSESPGNLSPSIFKPLELNFNSNYSGSVSSGSRLGSPGTDIVQQVESSYSNTPSPTSLSATQVTSATDIPPPSVQHPRKIQRTDQKPTTDHESTNTLIATSSVNGSSHSKEALPYLCPSTADRRTDRPTSRLFNPFYTPEVEPSCRTKKTKKRCCCDLLYLKTCLRIMIVLSLIIYIWNIYVSSQVLMYSGFYSPNLSNYDAQVQEYLKTYAVVLSAINLFCSVLSIVAVSVGLLAISKKNFKMYCTLLTVIPLITVYYIIEMVFMILKTHNVGFVATAVPSVIYNIIFSILVIDYGIALYRDTRAYSSTTKSTHMLPSNNSRSIYSSNSQLTQPPPPGSTSSYHDPTSQVTTLQQPSSSDLLQMDPLNPYTETQRDLSRNIEHLLSIHERQVEQRVGRRGSSSYNPDQEVDNVSSKSSNVQLDRIENNEEDAYSRDRIQVEEGKGHKLGKKPKKRFH
ncbi:hypothetical protein BKA69DRAFT_1120835 [Paraphysoderma sedebokerense]|nr:hypothetical protein BKA69DRAFT_1120835 [Paraphysoderma sedebokerense]